MIVMDNYYTSQLAVNFTTGLDGRTIECAREGGSTTAMIIGSSELLTTTGRYISLIALAFDSVYTSPILLCCSSFSLAF